MTMNNVRFDLVIHWIFAIIWALLAISGFAMISANFGWIINFNYVMADTVHRLNAAAFVIITFISVVYEIIRKVKKDNRPQPWFILGRSGYQLFNLLTYWLKIQPVWECIWGIIQITAVSIIIWVV